VIVGATDKNNQTLMNLGTTPIQSGVSLAQLLKRPQLSYENTAPLDAHRPDYSKQICDEVEIQLKYEGYIKKQNAQVKQFKKMESKRIPENIDYHHIEGLRLEAVEKLSEVRPMSIGQASRISGVSPADITVIHVYLENRKKGNANRDAEN
jgi:tRNA uridine 5-carboxymethylaminomethyl modification enzyme